MRKWSHIIFLICLVPRMPALEGNITFVPRVKILDTQDLFAQVDDLFKKLACPESLLQQKETVGVIKSEFINTKVDPETRLKAQVRFELINAILSNPESSKKCANIGLLNENHYRSGPLYPLLDIYRRQLCFIHMIFGQCVGNDHPEPPRPPFIHPNHPGLPFINPNHPGQPYPHPPMPHPTMPHPTMPQPPMPSEPSSRIATPECIPIHRMTKQPDGSWENVNLLSCTINGNETVIMPMPSIDKGVTTPPISTPSPSHGISVCNPFDQYVMHPNGKTEKLKQLNCTLPNGQYVIRPMPESENEPGETKNSTGFNPEIFISQKVDVNIPKKKPRQ